MKRERMNVLNPRIVPSMNGCSTGVSCMHTVMMRSSVTMIDRGMVSSTQSRPPALLDGRDVHDDHRVIVLDVDARTFLVIQRGAQVARSTPVCWETVASSTSVGSDRHSQEPFSGFSICSTWPLIVLNILNM